MKQTAVEFLVVELKKQGLLIGEIDNLIVIKQAKELEKQHIIEHSVELAKLLFSNPIKKSGKTPQELVNSYFKSK